MQGFDNLRIINYENSFNTYQIYSHYRLEIPNQQTQLNIYIVYQNNIIFFQVRLVEQLI